MKNFIDTTDLAIWLALIAGQVVLCLCIFKKDAVRKLPWFSAYVFAFTIKNVLLFALAFLASYTVYYNAFHVSTHVVSALAFLTLVEFGRWVLPGLNLPHNKKAFAWFLTALAGIAIFTIQWPLRYVEKRIDVAAYLVVAASFIFIAVYSRYLGLHWARVVRGLSFTLGLLYLVDGVAKAFIDHYPMAVAVRVRLVSEIAGVLAVAAWIIVILSPWGVREMTEGELLKLGQLVDHMEADFIAAVRNAKFMTGGDK
ncbi:MAG TPA: hypothetical protein VFQ41_15090 [Candidatus Angelobacter sp.]|nr:hypothetical protein [Candidatus Angelobacter sp.]